MPPEAQPRLRVIIVDDEEPARGLLREFLSGNPDVELVAECANGFEAVRAVQEMRPDLLLLDVQMPKLDGFEVLELLERPPAVVFITAYDQHALRAFEVHAVDYLLKPFSQERLGEALARARDRAGSLDSQAARALSDAARPPGAALARILVRDGAKVHVVPLEKVDCIEAQDDYVSIRHEGRALLKQQTLASLEGQLDATRFVRVHRSWILNVERLARLEPATKDSWVAILRDGTKLPVSRTGHDRLKALL